MIGLKKISRISNLLASTALIAISSAANAQSILPSDPTVVSGNIGFALPSSDQLDINQSSSTGIIDWGTFSIGSGNTVSINNGTGATLNRVTGGDASQILGTLDATGSVYLLNQNGVFIGADGVIKTGGDFVASTLNVTNSDFLNGGDTVFEGSSGAGVLNFGKIGSLGGNVALIARNVVNEGSISAPNGTAALIAGREILMRDIALDNGMFVVRVGGEDTSVTDKGSISAATAELRANGGNIYALAGNTSGTIRATGVAKKGGRIFLTAGGGAIKTTKTIAARKGNGAGGRIIVNAANIEASNLYDASASSGKGGFVELYATAEAAFSGKILAYGDDVPGMGGFAEVSGVESLAFTGIADTGGGTLLLDPDNIEISSGPETLSGASVIDPNTIISNLELGNIIVETTGVDGEAGTILVSDQLLYDSEFDLTFLAHGDILVRAPIQNESTNGGDLNFVAGWDGSTDALDFDPTPFSDADIANPVIFGNASGGLYNLGGSDIAASGIFSMQDFGDLAVGSATGDTRVFAESVEISALTSGGTSFESILGARVNNTNSIGLSPITGDIIVRAADQILVSGGSNVGGFGQIGHVGSAVTASGGFSDTDVDADIFVEAGGDIILRAGTANATYAMIGHGSVDDCFSFGCNQSEGSRQGDITVLSDGEISIDGDFATLVGGGVSDVLATIGHGTGDVGGVFDADIFIEAASIDDDAFQSVPSGSSSTFEGDLSFALAGGAVTVNLTDSGLAFGNNTIITSNNADLVISVSGNLQFGSGSQIIDTGGDGEYALAAGGDIFFLPGNDLFDIGDGNWTVYSTRPDENTGDINSVGGLDPDVIVYDRPFDINDPHLTTLSSVGINDNTLVYSADPQLAIDTISFTYGQDATAIPTYSFTVDGIEENPEAFGFQDLRFETDPNVIALSPAGFVNAGTYINGLTTVFDPVSDATVSIGADFDTGTDIIVTPALLTVTLEDEVKDTGTGYTGSVFFSGFVTGEDDSLITSGPTFTYTGNDGSEGLTPGTYDVGGFGSAESSGNYIFDESDMASLTINDNGVTGPVIVTPPVTPPTEEPTADIPETPRDQNPSSSSNRAVTPPILVDATDEAEDEGFVEVSRVNTDQVVNQLQRGKEFCEGLAQSEYVIDCMGDSLQAAADGLPEGGDYAAVRAALEEASAKLAALARQNASSTLTRGLVQSNGQQSSRRFTPVATEALAALNAEAAAIIDEAQTILLRSAQNSERRKVHYQRIAEAVGSNKILLRS